MVKKAMRVFASSVFGKEYLDGYYRASDNTSVPHKNDSKATSKNYVFSTVFPSRTMMDLILNNSQKIRDNLK